MPIKKPQKHMRHFIDKKLLFRLRMFVVVFLVMTGVVIFETYNLSVNPFISIGGLLLGIVIGFVMGRMYKLSWDKNESKVVGNLDRVGMIFLVVYIIFAIFRNRIFGNFIHGGSLSVFTLGLTAGSMFGRVLFARKGIVDLLEAVGVY
jgi:hypothetical protein